MTNETLADIVGSDILSKVRANGARARGLPGAAYTSKAFLDLEYQYFRRTWLFVGFAHQAPEPGDAYPFPGLPFIMVRGRDGKLRAFHNVCRHRNHRILSEPCSRRPVLTCPYHGWAFDLDGRLRATPYFDGKDRTAKPTLDPVAFGLKPVRLGVWLNFVFINIDGNAPPLEEHVAPLAPVFAKAPSQTWHVIGHYDMGECPVNWKVIHENAIEAYHEPFNHPEFTVHTPLELHQPVVDGALAGDRVVVPDGEGVVDWRLGYSTNTWYVGLMPNFFVAFTEVGVGNVHLNIPDPHDPRKTHRQVCGILFNDEPPTAEDHATWDRNSKKLNYQQDLVLWEPVQYGFDSPFYDELGVLSTPWEAGIAAFNDRLLVELGAA